MLTRILSLSKQNDFFKISQKGKVFQNELFVLKILENNFNYYRLAVVISNKISKKAVWRNRWRRQIKEAFKAIIKEKEIILEKKQDLIIIVKKPLFREDYKKIKNSLNDLLVGAGFCRRP